MKRIKPIYLEEIKIPKKFKVLFWDCPDGKTYLEKFILRILQYGTFEDIKFIYKKFPNETFYVAFKYPEIKRGVKFWIKLWKEREIQKHFKNFYLSGGTALMIKHKHRISEDLDFFSKKEFSFTRVDFEKKFPHQSFEIYLGAVFSIEDYPSKIIKEVMKEWKI